MVDAADLKSAARKGLWVRIPPPAPLSQSYYRVGADAGVFFHREPGAAQVSPVSNPSSHYLPSEARYQSRPTASHRNSINGPAVWHESTYISMKSGEQASSWLNVVPAANDFNFR